VYRPEIFDRDLANRVERIVLSRTALPRTSDSMSFFVVIILLSLLRL
jgi:hypothetical protein